MNRDHPPQAAFTLAEIVIAMGIFAVSIVGVVFLLGSGLKSSSETQHETALVSALQTTIAVIKGLDQTTTETTLHFSGEGMLLLSATDAYYRFTTRSVNQPGEKVDFWTIEVESQLPVGVPAGSFLTSRLKK